VLIDVSGSMKQNDPGNLRIPALKLLLELLPPDSQAGVWLFAGDTETLIPPSKVDSTWKQSAAEAADHIHSNGLFTDIERALQLSINGWDKSTTDGGRHIVLLTDGMVDVKGNQSNDQASRMRILKQFIPRLQTLGVHVYTIALSDQADHPLLKQLAVATDGRNEVAHSAEQLQRTFLNIFKSAVPRDSVPLNDNTFKIDSSIEEFSLLVFRQPNSPATELIKPSGEHWTYDKFPDNAQWHHEEGYDLITVTNPMPGSWKMIANVDPDNQVMIVTDLKLKVTPLPNYLVKGEKMTLQAELTEHDQRITRENFLRLVQFNLQQDNDPQSDRLLVANPEHNGVFSQTLESIGSPGLHTLRLKVDGKTFQRTWEQNIEVTSTPVEVEIDSPADNPAAVLMRLIPDTRLIDPQTFGATAIVSSGKDNFEKSFSTSDQVHWQLPVAPPQPGQEFIINFQIQAQDHDGQPLTLILKPVTVEPPVANPEKEETPEEGLEEDVESLLEEDLEPQTDWLKTALIAGAVNLVLIVGGFFAWRWLRIRTQQRHEILLHRLTGELKES